MKHKVFLTLAVCALFLTACASTPKEKNIKKEDTQAEGLKEVPGFPMGFRAAIADDKAAIVFYTEAPISMQPNAMLLLQSLYGFFHDIGWRSIHYLDAINGTPYCVVDVFYNESGNLKAFRVQKYMHGEKPKEEVIKSPKEGHAHLVKLHEMCSS